MQYAMYCENGHRIDFIDPETNEREAQWNNSDWVAYRLDVDANGDPLPLPKFCADCGAKTMLTCNCGEHIRYNDARVYYVPNYCTNCGEPYPWVKSALEELDRVTDEADELTDQDKASLKRAYPELTKNTPKSRGAMDTLKRLYLKFSPDAMSIIRPVLTTVLTDEFKRTFDGWFK